MDSDRLTQRLMATFVGELDDHRRSLEQSLLALEKAPAAPAQGEVFAALFRTAHSLKGSARSVRIGLLEAAGHWLEEVFAAARDERLPVDAAFFAALLPIVDALGEAATRLRAGAGLAGAPLETLVRQLPSALAPASDALSPMASPPPVAHVASSAQDRRSALVRVPAEKLDALLMQSGELLTLRHRADARNAEALALQDLLAEHRKHWRRTEQCAAKLARRGAEALNGAAAREESAGRAGLPADLAQALARSKETLARLEHGLQHLVAEVEADRRAIEQTTAPLDAEVRRARMLPFAEACAGLERMLRDLTTGSDKKAEIVIEGGEIELDRGVLEEIKDPLLHLVRNAVDHGIEPMATRRSNGKSAPGRVVVSAALRGTRVEVTVSDDGRGLDLEAIRRQLRAKGLPLPRDDQDLAQAIFRPGFSTAPVVTPVSGRGVGLDVVKTRLAAMRGTVDLDFAPGRGTRFTLSLPLTLTSVRAILVGAGSQVFALDTVVVQRLLRIGAEDIRSVEGREIVMLAGAGIPIVALTDALGASQDALPINGGRVPVVVLAAGSWRAAFVVDSLLAEREIMVRSLGPRLRGISYVTGGSVLPDGRVALFLNAAALVEQVVHRPPAAGLAKTMTGAPRAARKRLLVVDDSVTIRTLEKSILESAGYDVMVAADGAEAWQLLLEKGADLVVSDVEMPNMDGFALTEAIRGSRRFRTLPVVLVTARESDADKARGMAVGADAYRLKSAFDQNDLLAVIEQIL